MDHQRPPPPIPVYKLPVHDPEDIESRSEESQKYIQDTLAMAETASGEEMRRRMANTDLMYTAIDPPTGDSVVHRAAAAGNRSALSKITLWYGRSWNNVHRAPGNFWVLMTHQNRVGDTALHAAARAGSWDGVRAVYRALVRERWDEPSEEWDWDNEQEFDPLANRVALDFVCRKNLAGHDAATEAREAGHEDLAVFLERIAARIDYDNMRGDAHYMRQARKEALRQQLFYDEEDEEQDGEKGGEKNLE